MIKLNIPNPIPRHLTIYLLGIIPGILFHLSVAFGDPAVAHRMIERAKQVYPFEPYGLFVLFVFSCLVTGQTFFFLSWFADIFLSILYQVKRYFVSITFASWWMYKWFGKLLWDSSKAQPFHPVTFRADLSGQNGQTGIATCAGISDAGMRKQCGC